LFPHFVLTFRQFIFSRIKKDESRRYNYVKSRETDIASMKNSPHVPLVRQITEEKRRGKELRVVLFIMNQ
jgi:hypothetical protein